MGSSEHSEQKYPEDDKKIQEISNLLMEKEKNKTKFSAQWFLY